MSKNNQDPIQFIETHKLNPEDFESSTKRAITIYEKLKAKKVKKEDEKSKEEALNKAGENLLKLLQKEIEKANKKPPASAKGKSNDSKTEQKKTSEKVVQETEEVVDELEECKNLIKEQKRTERQERERKIETGELKRPPKKTRVTKIKESLIKVLKYLPLSDPKIVSESEDELIKCANALFKLHGMNQFKQVEKGIKEEADNLIEKHNEQEEKKKEKELAT